MVKYVYIFRKHGEESVDTVIQIPDMPDLGTPLLILGGVALFLALGTLFTMVAVKSAKKKKPESNTKE